MMRTSEGTFRTKEELLDTLKEKGYPLEGIAAVNANMKQCLFTEYEFEKTLFEISFGRYISFK